MAFRSSLDQLIETLQLEETPDLEGVRKVSGPAGGGKPVLSEMGAAAAAHGHELFEQRLGLLTHELRDVLHTAMLAVHAIKAGNVGWGGATGAMLAHSRGRGFTVSSVDPEIALHADRDLLFSAVGTLLHNAFKFTTPGAEVSLNAFASADRVVIDVEDRCGGLPPGAADGMFRPFTQFGEDKSGLGLGLSICRRSVEATDGVLSVHDMPGTGCIFTIDLPRHAVETSAAKHV